MSTIRVRTRPRVRSATKRTTAEPSSGTKHWLDDPTIPVCSTDGCHFDAGTCGHGGPTQARPLFLRDREPDRGSWE